VLWWIVQLMCALVDCAADVCCAVLSCAADVCSVVQLMALLLEENTLESLHTSIEHKQSNIIISEAFVELSPMSILTGQNCVFFVVNFHSLQMIAELSEFSSLSTEAAYHSLSLNSRVENK